MTSPTVHADFLYARVGVRPDSFIAYRMRRCTGLSPSRTSGSARETMTLIEYSRNELRSSVWISIGSSVVPLVSIVPFSSAT